MRERGCIARINVTERRGLSIIEVKVADRCGEAFSRAAIAAASVSCCILCLISRSALVREPVYLFAGKRIEQCDVLHACDTLGFKALRLHRTFERCDLESNIDGLMIGLIEIALLN